MFSFIFKNIILRLGIDKSIAYVSGAKIVRALAEVVTLFFITRFLTGVEQGFYYTFGSIVALQLFFELGLTGIITQFVAHEASCLKFVDHTLIGDAYHQSRLAYLLHFSVKWYGIISILFFVVVSIAGVFFFTYDSVDINVIWLLPWLLLVLGTATNLFLSPIVAILMGLGKVKEVSKFDFIRQLIVPLFIWIGLVCKLNLYVIAIGTFVYSLLIVIYIYSTRLFLILKKIWKIKITDKVSYQSEIFPYQWKIALSWISGYFIFQLFNPVLFVTEGPVMAGKMGMTLAVLNGINMLSLSWINTKVPLYSSLIAQRRFDELDILSKRTLSQMVFVCVIMLFIVYIGIFFLREYNISWGNDIGNRFLDYLPMAFMMIAMSLNLFVSCWTTYLRCHKREPFLYFYMCLGLVCTLSTILLGKHFGVMGIAGGYCFITLVFLPWAYFIFKTKSKEWHHI